MLRLGSKQLVVTSVADPTKTITVNVEVTDAVFNGLNDFDITTTCPEANQTEFINGWAARGSGGKLFGFIDMYEDAIFWCSTSYLWNWCWKCWSSNTI